MEALLDYMPLEIKVKISEYILFGDDSSLWMRFKRGVLCMQETRENYEKTKDIPALKQAMDYLKRRNELIRISCLNFSGSLQLRSRRGSRKMSQEFI